MLDTRSDSSHRLNVLLTDDEHQHWAGQLPRLLEPQGVRAICVEDVPQALEAIESHRIHAAVVNLEIPMDHGASAAEPEGGLKLLRVIQRLEPVPPAVVIRGRRFDRRDGRTLSEALKLDAFSVLDQPVQLEQLLEVMRRMLRRYYGGRWPGA